MASAKKTRSKGPRLTFSGIRAQQSTAHQILYFAWKADDLGRIAAVSRIGRDAQGTLSGFQRPQIAAHIEEIRDYLQKDSAVLPNPIVVAFTQGVSIKGKGNGVCQVSIDVTEGPPGLVVDG